MSESNHDQQSVAVEVRDLHKSFGENHVLKGASLRVHEDEVLALIGPSGSGKSTLLRCLNLLEIPNDGELSLSGVDVPWRTMSGAELSAHRRQMGMVFQHFHLFPHKRVIENVMEGPVTVLGLLRDEARERASKLLAEVGLEDKADAWPSSLSGGQKQRVAIARALAMQPRVVLLDEVTSALDVEMIAGINELLEGLAKSGMTMVIVTHDLAFARKAADRIVFMDEGVIIEEGTPAQILDSPTQARTKTFVEQVLQHAPQ